MSISQQDERAIREVFGTDLKEIFYPNMIDALLKDMGIGKEDTDLEKKVAAATREYCLKWYKEYTLQGDYCLTLDMEQTANCFYDGYTAALTGQIKVH